MKKNVRSLADRTARRAAFTMIELLVVVAIIAILVGIVIGVAGLASRKSASGKALSELEEIKNALEEYRLANGTYFLKPVTATGADYNQFVQAMSNHVQGLNHTDPWGRPYQYQPTSTNQYGQVFSYRLWSYGPTTATVDDVDSASGVY